MSFSEVSGSASASLRTSSSVTMGPRWPETEKGASRLVTRHFPYGLGHTVRHPPRADGCEA
jgi:hypothetical protein